MKNVKQFLIYIISALFAFFFPEIANGGIEAVFVTFTALVPAVIAISAAINTWQQIQDDKAWMVTGAVGVLVSYLGYWLGLGIMAEGLWWHPLLYAVGAVAVASWGFSLSIVKALLATIFDYRWKN